MEMNDGGRDKRIRSFLSLSSLLFQSRSKRYNISRTTLLNALKHLPQNPLLPLCEITSNTRSRYTHTLPPHIRNLPLIYLSQTREEEEVRTCVLRFFLCVSESCGGWVTSEDGGESGVREGGDFLQQGSVRDERRRGGRTSMRMKAILECKERSERDLMRS
jgi:hypothetical protein